MGNAANAVLGLHPEIYPPDPYQLDKPGLVPEGWVQSIEGKKGEQGAEWCGTSSECFSKVDTECEKRIIEFVRRNAKAGKPFHAQYWPNFLNFLEPEMPKRSVAGLKVAGSFPQARRFHRPDDGRARRSSASRRTRCSSPWPTTDRWCTARRRAGACCP